ncbi:uncharacterized protein ACA1_287590 [Acanthamoeba castellanii str. Neff]|uniref:Dysbindin n=1 Tax=Acanthamoeba castellanii (strain ATCC 30010 / Neff) TaxID=1257118 RepID=L8HIN6_ACACF|nr:uncharacterized protein ACA1_287590 [Acanthamoeba castellanii str. Neff]ELR25060.1 hypothetical protein ACA1_287590 [Acanthamoeba castellanii str. Neff]
MHENQVTLAAQAETTDQRVRPVLERCNAQYRAINALYKELWTLPKVLEGLASFQQSLRAICDDIDNLEVLLAERNVEVEALELERWKITQQHKLEEYRQIKRGELQRLEKEMQAKKKQLEKELLKGEEREKKKLEEEERKYREACEAAFRHSMEEFKKYGPQAIPRAQVKESLEQISLGAVSDSDLEQFLGSDDEDDAEDLIGEDERWGHKWEADNEPEDAGTNSESEKEKGSNDSEDTEEEEDKHQAPSERPAAGEDDEQSTRQ